MQKYIYVAMLNAAPGADDALNAWLDDKHLPEQLRTPGFLRVTRYELVEDGSSKAARPQRYLHIYEIETDDLAATQAALAAGRPQRTPVPAALDMGSAFAAYYKVRG